VGLFDWLFRRKDRYKPGLPREERYGGKPPPIKAFGGPPPPPPSGVVHDTHTQEPFTGLVYRPQRVNRYDPYFGFEYNRLNWRQQRSRKWIGPGEQGPSPRRIASLELPQLAAREDLAALLDVSLNDLWQYLFRPQRVNNHYVARYIPKKSGGRRLILAPKARLRALQRRLHDVLVSRLPLRPEAHGFRRGHSPLTCAAAHAGREVVICMDIEDFFPSFDHCRVAGYFRALGYDGDVALCLAKLTTVTPDDVPGAETDWCRDIPLLPQGAPTSPGIANAICWRMDKRLAALARKFGGRYARYADDLTFSGGREMSARVGPMLAMARRIIRSEGLNINEAKTRVMRRGRQQRVTGLVVNERPNLSRREFDKLKAILTNCIRYGPESQNRAQVPDFRSHLQGRVAHALHVAKKRGAKMRELFDRIVWHESTT
jgi:RNA-directed DNA polymerase